VEFLLLARQLDQAFDVAQAHGEMDTFAALVAANAAPAELQRIAAYYESRGELSKAGDVALRCGQQARAVTLYLQV
jgi:WD repeat-containing protein 19